MLVGGTLTTKRPFPYKAVHYRFGESLGNTHNLNGVFPRDPGGIVLGNSISGEIQSLKTKLPQTKLTTNAQTQAIEESKTAPMCFLGTRRSQGLPRKALT